jgi:hypothetical protein
MMRVGYFLLVLIPVLAVTLYIVRKFRRLSDFLETLAKEHRSSNEKLVALLAVWKTNQGLDS